MWYCAHAIFYYETDVQESYLVHENVYLIFSNSVDEALNDAKKIALQNQDMNEDGHLEVNGEKAKYLFAGIRKLIEVESNYETSQGILNSGTEVTYSEMEVDTIDELNKLASGEFVEILYRE